MVSLDAVAAGRSCLRFRNVWLAAGEASRDRDLLLRGVLLGCPGGPLPDQLLISCLHGVKPGFQYREWRGCFLLQKEVHLLAIPVLAQSLVVDDLIGLESLRDQSDVHCPEGGKVGTEEGLSS